MAGPAPRRARRWGETKGALVRRPTQQRLWGHAKAEGPPSAFEGLILQPNVPLLLWGRLGVGWGGCEPRRALQAAGRAMA